MKKISILETKMARVTRHVDIIMEDYKSTIQDVIDSISNNPETIPDRLWGKLLSVDNTCRSATTEKCRYKSLCIQCTELSHLSDMQLDEPFLIECGSLMGTWMKITKSGVLNLEAEIDVELKDETIRLVNVEKRMLECGTPDTIDTIFLKCDPVTCNILVSWLVESALQDGFSLLSAYKCSDGVYRLKKIRNNLISLDGVLTSCDALSILIQTILMMRRLSQFHFVHGNPSPYSLRLTNEPISKAVDGIHVNGAYTVGLDPGDHSSITSWKTRICSSNRKWRGTVLKPTMENRFIVGKVTLYTIPPDTKQIFMDRRSSGIPIYPGSLDLYCMIIGLLCHPLFEPAILGIGWSSLWVNVDDMVIASARIKAWRCRAKTPYPTHPEIITILEGLWLRCDAVEVMVRNIKATATR